MRTTLLAGCGDVDPHLHADGEGIYVDEVGPFPDPDPDPGGCGYGTSVAVPVEHLN